MRPQQDDTYSALRLDLEIAQQQAQNTRALVNNRTYLAGGTTTVGTSQAAGTATSLGNVTITGKFSGKFLMQGGAFALNNGAAVHQITFGVIVYTGTVSTGTVAGLTSFIWPTINVASGTNGAGYPIFGEFTGLGTSGFGTLTFSFIAFSDSSTVMQILSEGFNVAVSEVF
jgi:hypothetical protein